MLFFLTQEVDSEQAQEALAAVLHTILFNRALGDVTLEVRHMKCFPDISYSSCGSAAVDRVVAQGVADFIAGLELVGPDLARGELSLSFYESKRRKSFMGLGGTVEDKVVWERWAVPVVVNKGTLQAVAAEASLRSMLFRVLCDANDFHHLPRLRGDATVYSFELAASKDSGASASASKDKGGLFAKILTQGPPVAMRFNV